MRYTMVSGVFFALLTCVQLLRVVMGWPVRVASVDVPVWASVVAAVVVGALATWSFRVSARAGGWIGSLTASPARPRDPEHHIVAALSAAYAGVIRAARLMCPSQLEAGG